jgi:exoribonuclease R
VHDKPSDERLQLFAIEAKKLGFKITTDLKDIQPIDVSK